jgi:hypothetical protein
VPFTTTLAPGRYSPEALETTVPEIANSCALTLAASSTNAAKMREKTLVQTFIPLLLDWLRTEFKLIASTTILAIALAEAGFFKWILQKIMKVCAWKSERGSWQSPFGAGNLRRSKLIRKYNNSGQKVKKFLRLRIIPMI